LVSLKDAAVKPLSDLSTHDSPQLRWRSLEVLKRIGPAAQGGVPACLKALEDKEWYVRREAVRALTAVAPKDEQVVARFRDRVTNDEEWTVRKEAFDALRSWGAEGKLEVKPY
jgi:HEAT repeat protein